MKTILIVGGGFGQVPAILKAKEIDLRTVCIDRNPNAVGMSLADIACPIDVIDLEGALEVAKKNGVDGVMTMQSDLPVPTIGYINDKLGLKGVSYAAALACSNKIETRRRLAQESCEQPEFIVVKNVKDAFQAANKIGFPCVIKAPDSSGSRGVVKINKADDIPEGFSEALRFSRGKEILVEEYVSGLEFGAQTFSIGGECKMVLLHNDLLSSPPYMIPIGHSFPFKYLNKIEREKAVNDIKKAVLALGIYDGPANVDIILDEKTRQIKIIEIGARIGATCLPELVEYYTGIDWVEASICSALGEEVNLRVKKQQPVAARILESPADGKFLKAALPDRKVRNLAEFEVSVKSGELVSKMRKGTDRIGKVICLGKTVEEAEKSAANIVGKIVISLV